MPSPSTDATPSGARSLLIALALVFGVVYLALWWADFGRADPSLHPLRLLTRPEGADALLNLAEVTVGVLGVTVTVVSIIVELAATRYTPRITELFLRDATNVGVLGFFVLTTALSLWVSLSLDLGGGGGHPRTMVLVTVGCITLSLLLLLPYFGYVFHFLGPTRVVGRLAEEARRELDVAVSEADAAEARARFLARVGQLGDMAHQSVRNEDRLIVAEAVAALTDVGFRVLEVKGQRPGAWFDVFDALKTDTDFVAFHRDVLRDLVPRRTFAEMKVLRQLETVFSRALVEQRDLAHLVGMHTRRLGVRGAERDDPEVVDLTLRFLNTFMRSAVNARDTRTAYNLMSEYRLFAQGLLDTTHRALAVEVAHTIQRYGQLAFKASMPFIQETAAYDLGTLVERIAAEDAEAPEHDAVLAVLLDVDRRPEDDDAAQEASLRGVRKAQVKLATWYLQHGDEERARWIFRDMRAETRARLASIRHDLESTVRETFSEISDRGVDFDYLPPERRRHLETFFGWFTAARGGQT